jgi:TfoX/Sxy family transcriptional regulator of competence genes
MSKMKFIKPPPELIAAFESALPKDPRAERRKQFGFPCSFVNGNMWAGIFNDRIMLRVPETERAPFYKDGAAPMVIMGRTMKDYVDVPPGVRGDVRALRRWLGQSFEWAATLPPKKKKATKK